MLSPDHQQEVLDNVVDDFTQRLRSGERPAIAEYTRKHPDLSDDIEELLTSVAMIEELKIQNPPTHGSLKREMKEILKLERIGDYRIAKELGRGGMGIVFEAVHESLGRRVAIKVMPNRTFDDQKYLERFRREAQAAANLHHTNIVSVFGIGQTGEHHYYVMEFVDGESLSGILTRLNQQNESITQDGKIVETVADVGVESTVAEGHSFELPRSAYRAHLFNTSRERVRWAARLGDQIADGLAYAHAVGTLHRDIKPSNLLVDKNETIWLTDFGLVKNLGNQTITKTGDIIGTPQYMAPESFEGQYDERSETYCLGLTLYEMATLKPAFENASTPELIRRITTTTPIPPRKLDRKIPLDLERIIQKAISKEPRYRYQTANELRDDLRAFLDDRPINARRISMAENIWRWSWRNPLPAVMSLMTGLMICLIAITATIALTINNRALIESEKNKRTLEVENRRADYNHRKLLETIEFTHKAYDRMFHAKVLDESELSAEISLDGFMNVEGISASINESDAAFLDYMLDYYLQFAKDNRFADTRGESSLKEMSASSFRRVANIYHLIGQFDLAIEAYDKSIAVYEELQHSNPKGIPDALNLVRTIKEKGRALELNSLPGERKKVEEEFGKATKILREHENAQHTVMKIELAKTLVMQSSIGMYLPDSLPERFEDLGKHLTGVFARRSAKSLIGPVLPYRTRVNQRNRTELTPRERALNAQLRRSGKLIREASEIADELIKGAAKNDEVRFVRAICLARWSIILRAKNEHEKAKWAFENSMAALSELRASSPENAEYEFALAQNYAIRATEIASLEKAKDIMLSLSERYNRNLEYKQFLGNVCGRLGRLYRKTGTPDAAEQNLYLANYSYQTLTPMTPRNFLIQISGLFATLNYVDILMQNDKSNEAIHVLEDSIAEVGELQNNKSRATLPRLAKKNVVLLSALAMIQRECGNRSAAIAARKKANAMMWEAPGGGKERNRNTPRDR